MTALAALSHLIRTALVLALVVFFAFGSLAGAASAATGDHHAPATAMDGDHDHLATGTCPSQGESAAHEMGDGSCCVGTCSTILGVAPVVGPPVRRITDVEPFDHPVSARSSTTEFLRPPSLTI